jgi:ribonuclease R
VDFGRKTIQRRKILNFVKLNDYDGDEIYIPKDYVNHAFHMDQVAIKLQREQEGKRREGMVTAILGHGMSEVIGTFEKNEHYGFVIPDNQKIGQDIFVAKEHCMGAGEGDKVVVSMMNYGKRGRSPEGCVKEILGHLSQPGIDVLSIARGYDLPMEFSEKVLHQAQRVSKVVLEGDMQGREDIRSWQCVTIDGEDAKDLDDAITLTKDGDVYELGVHIADVANYVQENSALDREALKRGTSVYLVDRVIPMLPKELSNGICSLNQGEDRLALSCIMKLDEKGKLLEHRLLETVIQVDQRMTYTAVQKILVDKDPELMEEYHNFCPMFALMEELSLLLRKKRKRRGSIDFDFPESKIQLNALGQPVAIVAHEHNTATRIIEDFMLLANETVAKDYSEREFPFVYRTHEDPDMERMEGVLTFVRRSGVQAVKEGAAIRPKEIQKILGAIEGTPQEPLISRLLLRSMKQACYTTGCSGHFGLAAKHYCHFTSPIRRYPDLQIHRIIKDDIRGRMDQKKIEHYVLRLSDVAKQSSATERRAEEVERETIKLKKAEYMKAHINEEMEGVISGVTNWGVYVELPNTVEGLVHMNMMQDDYYVFDEERYCLVGERTKKVYELGQKVRIRVYQADIVTKTVDFVLVEDE